ncbi:hypothetical protein B566_EDAN002171 [Ephemera danica]|nr:hypothetical protein B566_EDAN002171 [Ephemera danica]
MTATFLGLMFRRIAKILKSTYFVFFVGYCLGVTLGYYVYTRSITKQIHDIDYSQAIIISTTSESINNHYSEWIHSQNYEQFCLSSDLVSYGNQSIETESKFLMKKINVLCAIFVKKESKAKAILQTWGKHCNKIVFFGQFNFKELDIPVTVIKPKSSWHYLCDAIRHLWLEHSANMQWVIFASDVLFVVPENLRLLVASLDHTQPYYLGHALTQWGENYNAAQAGYVLSSGALSDLAVKFNSSAACETSGKYWKNEDVYLGKYLGEKGVEPMDTRDHLGRGRFHAFNFNQLLFSRKLSPLGSYWRRSIYHVTEGRECCSDSIITFHGIEEDKMHQFYYLLYRLKTFEHGGHRGNAPAPTPIPDSEVWRHFLLSEGLISRLDQEVSADQFYQLSQSKVMPPSLFNEAIKREAEVTDI